MAALTLSPERIRAKADAARAEAHRLRAASSARRLEVRRSRGEVQRRKAKLAVTARWLSRSRERRYRSAWSDLAWQMPDGELDRVLVPVEADTSEGVDPAGIEPATSSVPRWRSPS